MTREEHAILLVLSRWLTPLSALFALTLLANWPAGAGVGFVAGLAISLPFAMNALILGVPATLVAVPPTALRLALAVGLAMAFAGAGLASLRWSAQIVEAGAFVATASGLSLALLLIMGRVAALRDSNW